MSPSQRLLRGGVVADVVVAGIGASAVVVGAGYGVTADGRVGPGFMPVMAGGVMLVFALVDLLRTVRAPSERAADGLASSPDTGVDIFGRSAGTRHRQLWTVFGLLLAAVLAVPLLGFLTAFALLVVVCSVVVEGRKLLPSAAVAAAVTALVWAVFVQLLSVPLPTGVLGLV